MPHVGGAHRGPQASDLSIAASFELVDSESHRASALVAALGGYAHAGRLRGAHVRAHALHIVRAADHSLVVVGRAGRRASRSHTGLRLGDPSTFGAAASVSSTAHRPDLPHDYQSTPSALAAVGAAGNLSLSFVASYVVCRLPAAVRLVASAGGGTARRGSGLSVQVDRRREIETGFYGVDDEATLEVT